MRLADDGSLGLGEPISRFVPGASRCPGVRRHPRKGGVWSTVDDLVRYTQALEAGELLSAGSRQLMVGRQAELTTPSDRDDPAPADAYGYAYFLGTVCRHRARFRPGDDPGYQSFLGYLPDIRATVVVLGKARRTTSTTSSERSPPTWRRRPRQRCDRTLRQASWTARRSSGSSRSTPRSWAALATLVETVLRCTPSTAAVAATDDSASR